MSDFGKKLIMFGIAAVLLFVIGAAITWFKVNEYDEGELVMNTAQATLSAVLVVFLAQLRSVFGVLVLTVSVLCASQADAGLLNFFRLGRNVQSACANGQCGTKAVKPMPLPAGAVPKFRKECGPNGCRLVPVK